MLNSESTTQDQPRELTRKYFLTAGETDAQGCMPMSLIFERVIEVATEHANRLRIGYADLITHGIGWVLARLSVEMTRYPRINQEYALTTWIEGVNRLYSDRCFLITDGHGQTIGHVRTMWIAIDMDKRTAADLSQMDLSRFPVGDRICPVPKPRKIPPFVMTREREHTFRFSDIDFNRHVNTVQYVRLLLNQWTLQFFDEHQIAAFDIAFHQECHCGQRVDVRVQDDNDAAKCEIAKADGSRAVAAQLRFVKREP